MNGRFFVMRGETELVILFLLNELYECIKAQIKYEGAKTIALKPIAFKRNSRSGKTV